MNTPRVHVTIVTWNSMRDLPGCLKSIEAQTFRDFSVLVVDNASQDGLEQYLRENHSSVSILINRRNLGYARAHNQSFHLCRSPFAIAMNPDVSLTPTFLNELISAMERDERIGSAGGKLLRPDGGIIQSTAPPIIDSAGLEIFRNRRVINRGEGERDTGQFDDPEPVFGVSGAAVCYRMAALKDTAIQLRGMPSPEFFDEDFFAYKEDVDLAWRLLRKGWKNAYVPSAVAFHRRHAQAQADDSPAIVARYRRKKAQVVNSFSYKNHLQLLMKNESMQTIFPHFPFIFMYEMKKIAYILIREPQTLRSFITFFRQFSRMLRKRHVIKRNARVPARSLQTWFHHRRDDGMKLAK